MIALATLLAVTPFAGAFWQRDLGTLARELAENRGAAQAELFYRWEKYKIDSFILQGLANYLPGALLLDANNGDFKGSLYGFALKFTF